MNTSSLSYPNIFDVAKNKVAVAEDRQSIANRIRLLLLTEPTELYMEPTYGVGLRKYIYQYNNNNVIAQIRDKLVEQLRLWEPCVYPDSVTVTSGLEFTGSKYANIKADNNTLNLTITVQSIYGDDLEINLADYPLSGVRS